MYPVNDATQVCYRGREMAILADLDASSLFNCFQIYRRGELNYIVRILSFWCRIDSNWVCEISCFARPFLNYRSVNLQSQVDSSRSVWSKNIINYANSWRWLGCYFFGFVCAVVSAYSFHDQPTYQKKDDALPAWRMSQENAFRSHLECTRRQLSFSLGSFVWFDIGFRVCCSCCLPLRVTYIFAMVWFICTF